MVLAADKRREYYGANAITRHQGDVAAAATLFAGAMLNFDSSGNVVAATDAAGEEFAGVAIQEYNNSGGSAGDIIAEFETGQVEKVVLSSVEAADVGTNVFIVDDDTVTDGTAATNNVSVGKLVRIDGTDGFVHMGVYAENDSV